MASVRTGSSVRSAVGAVAVGGAVAARDGREAVALVVLDELVVGEPAIVHLRLGLVLLGLGALRPRALRGDLGFLFGLVGLGGAH